MLRPDMQRPGAPVSPLLRPFRALALLGLLSLPAVLAGCPAPRAGRGLLLVTVDTLRADRLDPARGGAARMPEAAKLAAGGTVLSQVVVPVPRTSQSVASLMTGLHPIRHGVRGLFGSLPAEAGPTLAGVLGKAGFATAAFTSNLVLRPGQGFERGFALYENPRGRWERDSAAAVVDDAAAWLDAQVARRPEGDWFLWVHLLDPHWPYEPPAPFDAAAGGVTETDRALFASSPLSEGEHATLVFGGAGTDPAERDHLRALYDAEVAATDAAIGRLAARLEATGRAGSTLFVVTADHGESLGEQDYWFAHGEYLYDNAARVAAIVREPGRVPAGRRLESLVRGYDLMPTLLELLGVAPPDGLDGLSRAAEILGAAESADGREIYIESDRDLLRPGNPKRFAPGYAGSWRALRTAGEKLIRIPDPGAPGGSRWEAYDLVNDPAELHDLAGALAGGGAAHPLAARLNAWEEKAAASEPAHSGEPETGATEMEILRSLGYVAGGPR